VTAQAALFGDQRVDMADGAFTVDMARLAVGQGGDDLGVRGRLLDLVVEVGDDPAAVDLDAQPAPCVARRKASACARFQPLLITWYMALKVTRATASEVRTALVLTVWSSTPPTVSQTPPKTSTPTASDVARMKFLMRIALSENQ